MPGKDGAARTGGKTQPSGRNSPGNKTKSGAKAGPKPGGRPGSGSRPSAAAAQRAVRAARGGRGRMMQVILPAVIVVVVAAVVIVGVILSRPSTPATNSALPPTGDTNPAVLASTAGQATGQTVDGVSSNNMEQVLFHIHAHLAVFVDGQPKAVPYGVGIVPPYQLQQTQVGPFVAGGTQYYWLHTHDESGILHVESPVQRTFTLGNFFDIWGQPLGPTQVGPAKGTVTAYVNNQPYTGNPRDIPLDAHNVIQLSVGTVVPFQPYTFLNGL
jgi:hypothetical protein